MSRERTRRLAHFIELCLPSPAKRSRPGFFAPPTRHIFVAVVNVGAVIVATRGGETSDEPC
jgi:hypothetical protein